MTSKDRCDRLETTNSNTGEAELNKDFDRARKLGYF